MITPIRVYLEKENSKTMAVRVMGIIVEESSRMDELMSLFFDEDIRVCQRAAWPVGLLADNHPELLEPFLKRMLDNLDTPHHDAVIRNTFRAFQFMDFPEELEGEVFDKSFSFFMDLDNAIAIQVFAMTVCGNLAMKYPELSQEVIPIIEERIPYGSAAYRSRGGVILKKLKKLK